MNLWLHKSRSSKVVKLNGHSLESKTRRWSNRPKPQHSTARWYRSFLRGQSITCVLHAAAAPRQAHPEVHFYRPGDQIVVTSPTRCIEAVAGNITAQLTKRLRDANQTRSHRCIQTCVVQRGSNVSSHFAKFDTFALSFIAPRKLSPS